MNDIIIIWQNPVKRDLMNVWNPSDLCTYLEKQNLIHVLWLKLPPLSLHITNNEIQEDNSLNSFKPISAWKPLPGHLLNSLQTQRASIESWDHNLNLQDAFSLHPCVLCFRIKASSNQGWCFIQNNKQLELHQLFTVFFIYLLNYFAGLTSLHQDVHQWA